jgi:hypothetical protein
MSLITLVKERDVADQIGRVFKRPRLEASVPLLVPPGSRRFTLVGTAFDYLLRFYIKRINPFAVDRKWVAEGALSDPFSPILHDAIYDPYTQTNEYKQTDQTRAVERIIHKAKCEHDAYIQSGRITDELLTSVLCLAQIDPMMRAGYVDRELGLTHEEDVQDLKQMISIAKPQYFKARDLCLLNPRFGKASQLVGGADADLFLDDTLIDIKVTTKLELHSETLHQLIGYVALNAISAIGDTTPRPVIAKAGVYFARHGYLFTFQISELIEGAAFESFVIWFQERARQKSAGPSRTM